MSVWCVKCGCLWCWEWTGECDQVGEVMWWFSFILLRKACSSSSWCCFLEVA
ncbi:hypothetical protein M758_4G025700 [Ceratodon purpureus]|uniref:Uncharacterized protein n=1 Tax=Ceratodon purpureus TaxID=3225 RepID=A0A8T0I4U9_CERPU|nr:hypothetical protein KC19_N012300 [Ceratodon purpureus]KAG0578512.1 hypothetical protein KC19_4G028600 [Ceratodon purpureus]KAG0617935.1 hypothetical protein M758_4G025700 [Ceratodon purpureus]